MALVSRVVLKAGVADCLRGCHTPKPKRRAPLCSGERPQFEPSTRCCTCYTYRQAFIGTKIMAFLSDDRAREHCPEAHSLVLQDGYLISGSFFPRLSHKHIP